MVSPDETNLLLQPGRSAGDTTNPAAQVDQSGSTSTASTTNSVPNSMSGKTTEIETTWSKVKSFLNTSSLLAFLIWLYAVSGIWEFPGGINIQKSVAFAAATCGAVLFVLSTHNTTEKFDKIDDQFADINKKIDDRFDTLVKLWKNQFSLPNSASEESKEPQGDEENPKQPEIEALDQNWTSDQVDDSRDATERTSLQDKKKNGSQ
jgi:hypothetical protein